MTRPKQILFGKEATMKKRVVSLTSLGALLALVLIAVGPSWAGDVDQRIKALEEELQRLKGEQIELKKNATAAEAALPTFTYRPGSGATIAAADQAWSFNVNWRWKILSYFWPDGQDANGFTSGEFFGRTNRLFFNFGANRGFYTGILALDLDTGDIMELQDHTFHVHFEQFNPALPTFQIGLETGATINWEDSNYGSTDSGWLERSLLVQTGINTGRYRGAGLIWDAVPLGSGTMTFESHYVTGIGASDNEVQNTDRKAYIGFLGFKPFTNLKGNVLSGMQFGIGGMLESVDSRADDLDFADLEENLQDRLRIRGNERRGRPVLFDANNIGDGLHYYITPGFGWRIGPYRLRGAAGKDSYEGKEDPFSGVKGQFWRVGNEIFLWGQGRPFGGSSRDPGSLALTWSFERVDVQCGKGSDCDPGTGVFNKNRILLRELDVKYFILRNLSLSYHWLWYDASNTPFDLGTSAAANARNTQVNIGCSSRATATAGKDCDWHTHAIGMEYRF